MQCKVSRHVGIAGKLGKSRYIPAYACLCTMAVPARNVWVYSTVVGIAGIASLCGVTAESRSCHNHYVTHFGSVQRHGYLNDMCRNALNNKTNYHASLICGSLSCTTDILVHEALRYRPSELFESECIDTLMQQCAQLVKPCATYHGTCCNTCDFSHRDGHTIGTRYMESYDTVTVVLIAVYIVLLVAIAKAVFVSYYNVPKMPIYEFYPSRAVDHP